MIRTSFRALYKLITRQFVTKPISLNFPLDTVSTTCGSKWVRSGAATELLNTGVKAAHPPATAGGTDRVQQRIGTFEAKPYEHALREEIFS